jgi:acyl-CoA hydrolase
MASFEVTLYGQFWVTPEVLNPTVIVRGGYGLMWMVGVVGIDALVMMFRARR